MSLPTGPQVWDEIATDRAEGCYIALALGDALGAPFEFPSKGGLAIGEYTGRLQFPYKRPESQWGGGQTGVIGQVTDDTELTTALLQSWYIKP